jgi:hypothetical protein
MTKAHESTELLIKQIIKKISEDSTAKRYAGFDMLGKPQAYCLEDAAGNHAFDDYPEVFGITENEGHQVRAFFQSSDSLRRNPEQLAYVQGLIAHAMAEILELKSKDVTRTPVVGTAPSDDIIPVAAGITVARRRYDKCQRCWNRSESVRKIPDYWDLCSRCAYDIDHHLVPASSDYHRENAEARLARLKYLIQPGLVFRHYKGKYYSIILQAQDTETQAQVVVYRSLYDGKSWVRKVDQFVERVGTVTRFTYLNMTEVTGWDLRPTRLWVSGYSRELNK